MTKIFEYAFTYSLKLDERTPEGITLFKTKHEQLIEVLKPLCKKYVFQLELTDVANWHYQGYFNLKTKKKLSTCVNEFDEFPGIHLSPASRTGRKALQDYCLKDATRQAGPWADKRVYMGQDLYAVPYSWQANLQDICLGPANDRTVIWIYDPEGNAGKSKFTKLMAYRYQAAFMAYSKTSDLINLAYKSDASIFIFDLTRAKPLDIGGQDLYAALESIKNGMLVNTKYETGTKLFMPPHVLVFANCKPDMSKLSQDRWCFKTLLNGNMYDGLLENVPRPAIVVPIDNPPPPLNIRGDDLPRMIEDQEYMQFPIAEDDHWMEDIGNQIVFEEEKE